MIELEERAPCVAEDWCSEAAAVLLKERIHEYWRARGYVVELQLVRIPFNSATRGARIDVRSNMLNGWPPATMDT
ncbi:MAG: hypothetical protein NW206_02615 [Hyphomonadaceae bacterium]|nr:hypothetical protein [Hyphomonadaceae bacterium]